MNFPELKKAFVEICCEKQIMCQNNNDENNLLEGYKKAHLKMPFFLLHFNAMII